VGFDGARPVAQRLLEIVQRLAQAPRALADPRAVVEQFRERGFRIERPRHLPLGALILSGVEERQSEMGPRLRRVAAREAVIGVVGIPQV
jgi:hypothetical protein